MSIWRITGKWPRLSGLEPRARATHGGSYGPQLRGGARCGDRDGFGSLERPGLGPVQFEEWWRGEET